MTTKPFVYMAGPITKPDPLVNTHRALYVAARMLGDGIVTPFVPHLTVLWELVLPQDYETWLAYDFEIIAKCDALLRLPGESAGADREVAHAATVNVPVFHDIRDLYAWAQFDRTAA